MCSVKVDCKPLLCMWLTMRTVAMVLEIIGPNNYYQLRVRQGKLLGRLRQYTARAAQTMDELATN